MGSERELWGTPQVIAQQKGGVLYDYYLIRIETCDKQSKTQQHTQAIIYRTV